MPQLPLVVVGTVFALMAAATPSPSVEVAWKLRSESGDAMGPWTRVALVVRGGASGTVHAGRIFGECSDAPANLWTASNKPLFMLRCGWAGNVRDVAVMRVGDSLVVRVHGIEENGPDAPTVETVGGAVKIPPRAAISSVPRRRLDARATLLRAHALA